MDSMASRALIKINKEEKQKSVFDRLPEHLQRHTLSFLVGDEIEKRKKVNRFSFGTLPTGSFFFECRASLHVSAATKAVHNLAHRININETLAFIQKYLNILQTLPFPIETTDRDGRSIRRTSIMGALVALDEFDVTEIKAEAKPHGLIPTVFSLFKEDNARNNHIKNQLQQQLRETSGSDHKDATEKRKNRYLKEIEILIHNVAKCADISNDWNAGPYQDLFNLELIQNFIKNAFKPDPKDNGEWGVVWDCWQLYRDHLTQLGNYVNNDMVTDKSRPNLGGWRRKAYLVADTVYMAFMRCSQFSHLEVLATGADNIEAGATLVRFDCSKGAPEILAGIGSTHTFDFFEGEKYTPRLLRLSGVDPWALYGAGYGAGGRGVYCETFVKQKHQQYTAYVDTPTHRAVV